MNLKVSIQIAVISVLAFGLSACPGLVKSSKSQTGASIKRVKGDPNVFIKDTAMNGLLALPAALSEASSSWSFDISGFEEESANVKVSTVIQEQTPGAQTRDEYAYPLQVEMNQGRWNLEGMYRNRPARFVFNRSSNGWVLERFQFKNENGTVGQSPFQVVHTSVKSDLSAFTLLLQDKTPGHRRVFSLVFLRTKPIVDRVGDTLYEYFFGPGVKVGWSTRVPRTLLICGEIPPLLTQIVKSQADEWSRVLKGRLQFRTQTRSQCPPFSDLNTQTLFFTTDWIEIAGDAGVPAQTFVISGEGRRELLDSDVMFIMGEYQEAFNSRGFKSSVMSPEILGRPGLQEEIAKTALHEIGHFLGLHHQFNKRYPSIMSYDENRERKLYDYDIKAVQSLYSE